MDDPFPDNLMSCIECFFKKHHPYLKPGKDVYHDVFATDVFFPLQRKRELAEMMQRARAIEPRVVMEIGTDKGGGLYHWCQCLPTVEKVIACEIRGLPYSKLFEFYFPQIKFLWLPMSSFCFEATLQVSEFLQGRRINCLFIDGDKSYFERDFNLYRNHMSDPGLVFMHDIQDKAPREAYDTVLARGYRHSEIVNLEDTVEAQLREDQGTPAINAYENWLRYWKGQSCGVGVIEMRDDE